MALNENQISAIVERVVARIEGKPAKEIKGEPVSCPIPAGGPLFATVDEAVEKTDRAQKAFSSLSLQKRRDIIENIRCKLREKVEELSRDAVTETGLGRFEDKIKKNLLVIDKTPGVEILETKAFSGEHGLTIAERAPYGVLVSITPSTNPSETVINNGIGIIAGGNGMVVNSHPMAKEVTGKTVMIMNQAIVEAGGPDNLITGISHPTIETATELMRHPGIRLIVVTGGAGVVKAAMNSGKKAIVAGPGNPPVVVDETADIEKAARDIVSGASFDNNTVCVCEKEVIVVAEVADELKEQMKKNGAYEVKGYYLKKLEELVVKEPPSDKSPGEINKDWVGKDAANILAAIGIDEKKARLIIIEVGEDHPLVSIEQLTPVLPIVKVPDVDYAIKLARKVEHGFGHTAVMHSKNIEHLSKMAKEINCSVFVKNGPSYSGLGFGGEGYTSFTIASPTGEGLTTARDFTRERRCSLIDYFRIV
jgi:acyl-CoA reductase-like NAD-dependent aldehyde dehydrogenase